MPHPLHANIDFSIFEEADFAVKVDNVYNGMTTNVATFPAPPVPITTLDTQLGTYTNILGTPLYATKAADLAAARQTIESTLRTNGVYVNGIANGDATLLGRSGYPISKGHLPVGVLSKSTINATSVAAGFDIKISTVDNADGYMVLYLPLLATPLPSDFRMWNWSYLPKHTGTLIGLQASTKYRLISVGLGTDPTLTMSDPIDRTTQ